MDKARARLRDLAPRRRSRPAFFTPRERVAAIALALVSVVLAVLDVLGVIK